MKVCDLSAVELTERFEGPGLTCRVGPFVIRLITRLRDVSQHLAFLYSQFPLVDPDGFADHRVVVRAGRLSPRRVNIIADGNVLYDRAPRRIAVPLVEWTLNLTVFHQACPHLLVHAAVVERDGQAVLLPGSQGSGKSTICAALIHRGWRLLSDEVAMIRSEDGLLVPVPRPVALKDGSIEAIRKFAPEAILGPVWPDTPKGSLVHVIPPVESVTRAAEPARPAWVIFPKYQPNTQAHRSDVPKPEALLRVAYHGFNYTMHGQDGFERLARLIDVCGCYGLRYGDLEAVVTLVNDLVTERDGNAGKAITRRTS